MVSVTSSPLWHCMGNAARGTQHMVEHEVCSSPASFAKIGKGFDFVFRLQFSNSPASAMDLSFTVFDYSSIRVFILLITIYLSRGFVI